MAINKKNEKTTTVPCRYTGKDVETNISGPGKGITISALLAALDSEGVLDDLE